MCVHFEVLLTNWIRSFDGGNQRSDQSCDSERIVRKVHFLKSREGNKLKTNKQKNNK